LKQDATQDRLDLHLLTFIGFAPTPPTTSASARVKARARAPYAAPERRRVRELEAWASFGSWPRVAYRSRPGKLDSVAGPACVWHGVGGVTLSPGEILTDFRRARRCGIVLDNASVHRRQAVKEVLSSLAAAGVELVHLSAHSPELNLIEGLWRRIKHVELPVHSYTTAAAMQAAVDLALDRHVAPPFMARTSYP
jgi:hypothetical protein